MKNIIEFLVGLPDQLNITVNGQSFYLVHGYPADNRWDKLWEKPHILLPRPLKDQIAIIGHTPTGSSMLMGGRVKPFAIWHGDGVIDIDCGCGKGSEHRRLACLRLNDMKEFYV